MIKKLTEELIHERLEDKGVSVPNKIPFVEQLEKILSIYGAEITSDWDDRCNAFFYEESTVDGYSVYIATTNDSNIHISEEVYYYEEGLFENLKDYIIDGYKIYISLDFEDNYSFEESITELYEEWYMEEYEEIEGILEDEGYKYPKSE